MKRILKLEIYKFWKDIQLRWIFFVMCLYVTIVPFLSVHPDFYRDATVTQLLMDGTIDCAMITIFVGLLGASVFLIDYTYSTYQNLIPYAGKNSLFIGKMISFLGVIAVGLVAWYAVAFVEAIIRSGQWCTIQVLEAYISRFINHFFMVLCHASVLAVIGIIIKRRALVNIATVLLWFSYAFIPINGKRVFDYVVLECEWGKPTSILLAAAGCMIFILCMVIGRLLFYREDR